MIYTSFLSEPGTPGRIILNINLGGVTNKFHNRRVSIPPCVAKRWCCAALRFDALD
ncbi:hypothetical protein [Pseudaminobacter soli (ex Li et al. 2025)]|uniref:hypothetical protein n=1 Tax=Pseudaminobacter soli (ex Li et al. 2025) TaxID=1295366 RepID=UPI0015E71D5B|nr:hypothetical protein [Mesorhizobium soli]